MTTMTPFRCVPCAAFRVNGEHFLDVFHVRGFYLIHVLGSRGKRVQLLRRSQKCFHRFCSVHVRRRLRGFTPLFSSGMSFLGWWGG